MAKALPNPVVLVIGDHPSAYLAATLLHEKSKAPILHTTIPGEQDIDRLTLLNPRFFSLHRLLSPLKRKLRRYPVYGLRFLGDDPGTHNEHRSRATLAELVSHREVRHAVRDIARRQGVTLIRPRTLQILGLDESGVDVAINGKSLRTTALVLAGSLDERQSRLLRLPDAWEHGVLHRYSFARLKGAKAAQLSSRPLVSMSLDLMGRLLWAWLLPTPRHVEIAVVQPVEMLAEIPPAGLLGRWLRVLMEQGVVTGERPAIEATRSVDMPLAGALTQEGVANRTLLIGPAGGFYSSSAEDLYPTCWSAIYAADALRKAMRERHLQDALQSYRHKWRTTLGEYLRGPQQNLRFLLPLIYRNPVMATRLTEAILTGKSVVR